MRYELMIATLAVAVILLGFCGTATADSTKTEGTFEFGPISETETSVYVYDMNGSNETRMDMDENGDDVVNETELANATATMIDMMGTPTTLFMLDGAASSSGYIMIDYEGALGAVNSTTLVTMNYAAVLNFTVVEADEHSYTMAAPNGMITEGYDLEFIIDVEDGWEFGDITPTGWFTLNAAGTKLTSTWGEFGNLTEDCSWQIVKIGGEPEPEPEDPEDDDDDDDGAPGFEMIAVVGALAVALIAFRRRR